MTRSRNGESVAGKGSQLSLSALSASPVAPASRELTAESPYDLLMKRLRLLIVLFVVSLACRPTESQTMRQPRQEGAPIPHSVSAARRTPVVVVAHDVLPAVVNIQTEATIRRREVDPFFDPFGFFGGGNREYHTQSLGSGFVWTGDGTIVTNNHV